MMSEVIVEGYVLRPSARFEGQWNVWNHRGQQYGWVRPDPDGNPELWLYQHLGDTGATYAWSRDEAARQIVGAARDAAEAILTGVFFEELEGAA